MKTLLATIALAISLAVPARAQQQAFVTDSTTTYSGVTVSTGTAIRIDNLNLGVAYLLNGRTEVFFGVPTGGQTIWWGYDSNVSSNTLSKFYGTELLAGSKANPAVGSNVPVYAVAADAAGASGQRINIQQGGPRVYKQIPGTP